MRVGGSLQLVGEPSVNILFADGTKPPRQATVAESDWDQLEILESEAD